eukprot:scaffold24729_cov117-Isochrysis_galbana.AAC.3
MILLFLRGRDVLNSPTQTQVHSQARTHTDENEIRADGRQQTAISFARCEGWGWQTRRCSARASAGKEPPSRERTGVQAKARRLPIPLRGREA